MEPDETRLRAMELARDLAREGVDPADTPAVIKNADKIRAFIADGTVPE